MVRELVRRVRMRGRSWDEGFRSVAEGERVGRWRKYLGKSHCEDWLAASSRRKDFEFGIEGTIQVFEMQ